MMHRPLLYLAGLLAVSGLFAQTPENQVSITFSLVGWGEAIPSIDYQQGASLESAGSVPLFKKGAEFTYSGLATLRFYLPPSKTPATSESNNEEPPPPAAVADIPLGAKHVLILLAPKGSGQFKAYVVPDDTDDIPAGHAIVMNLCQVPLALRVNKADSLLLEPGVRKLVSSSKKNVLLQMELAYKASETWKKFYSCLVPLPASHQTMVFLLRSDSEYFQDVDGNIRNPVQMVILREPVESSASDR